MLYINRETERIFNKKYIYIYIHIYIYIYICKSINNAKSKLINTRCRNVFEYDYII